MSKSHFLVYGDWSLVDCAIQLILDSDSRIRVRSKKCLTSELVEETTEIYFLERGSERAQVAIIIGDRKSQEGPIEGEYWININGEPEVFFRYNRLFATAIKNTLIAHGARESRRGKSTQ